jgi:hypothetical protein
MGGALTTLAFVYSRNELAFLEALLRGHGFFVHAAGGLHHAADPALAVALGGVRLQVPAGQAADARALLAGLDRPVWRGGVYTRSHWIDVPLALLLCFVCGVPPPARIPAEFVLEARA